MCVCVRFLVALTPPCAPDELINVVVQLALAKARRLAAAAVCSALTPVQEEKLLANLATIFKACGGGVHSSSPTHAWLCAARACTTRTL